MQKLTLPVFIELDGKVVQEPRKNPLDFAGNLDHAT